MLQPCCRRFCQNDCGLSRFQMERSSTAFPFSSVGAGLADAQFGVAPRRRRGADNALEIPAEMTGIEETAGKGNFREGPVGLQQEALRH